MNFLVLDFETLGVTTHTCPVVDCSHVTVNSEKMLSDNPYTFEEVVEMVDKTKFAVEQQVKEYGYVPEQDTIDWWRRQPAVVRKQVLPSVHDVDVKDWVKDFAQKIRIGPKIDLAFCRGTDFDPPILRRLLKDFGEAGVYEINLPFWKFRDTRSFFDGFFLFEAKNSFAPEDDENVWNEKFNKHDSEHDVAAEVLRLQVAHRLRADLI
tara:strand:+ start:954 stop:1577 length:624 start_codon:yes stop_codon:yes gene_type:complete